MEELEGLTKRLDEVRKDYDSVREEVSHDLVSENKAKASEAATMLNYAAESVRARQKDLKEGLLALNDAEVRTNFSFSIKVQM